MRWKRYSVSMDLTEITRKRTAEILADSLQREYTYSFGSDSYTIEDQRNQIWNIAPASGIKAEKRLNNRIVGANQLYQVKLVTPFFYAGDFTFLEKLTEALKNGEALINDTAKMSVTLDAAGINYKERYKTNLKNLYKSKGALFQKAFGTIFHEIADCSQIEEGTVEFPIFKSTLNRQELLSYIQMAQIINHYVQNQKSVSQKINTSVNEKFLMRTWLVRAGMIGDEYKFARKLFTEHLQGNSAWLKKVNCIELQEEQISDEEQTITNKNEISM